MMHKLELLRMIFSRARLVRKSEELEHYHPEPAATPHGEGGARHDGSGQLVPEMA